MKKQMYCFPNIDLFVVILSDTAVIATTNQFEYMGKQYFWNFSSDAIARVWNLSQMSLLDFPK